MKLDNKKILEVLKNHIHIYCDLKKSVPVTIEMNIAGNDKDFSLIADWFLSDSYKVIADKFK